MDERAMLSKMLNTTTMAAGFMRTLIRFSTDIRETQMGEILVRSLEEQIDTAKEYLDDPSKYATDSRPYLEYALKMSQEIEWILVPEHARVVKGDGGAYVETLVFVADSDIDQCGGVQ